VAKRYVLAKNCLKERIGNQGQKVDFFGRRHISPSGFAGNAPRWPFFALRIVAKWYVLARNCLKEWIGNKGQSWFFGSPPYFYFRFHLYGHLDSRFCLIFARIAQQSVLDRTNGLSSSKPCAYFRIVQSGSSFVCLSSVTFCIVVKRYVSAKNCQKEQIGNQGRKVDFLGHRHISTSGFTSTAT